MLNQRKQKGKQQNPRQTPLPPKGFSVTVWRKIPLLKCWSLFWALCAFRLWAVTIVFFVCVLLAGDRGKARIQQERRVYGIPGVFWDSLHATETS